MFKQSRTNAATRSGLQGAWPTTHRLHRTLHARCSRGMDRTGRGRESAGWPAPTGKLAVGVLLAPNGFRSSPPTCACCLPAREDDGRGMMDQRRQKDRWGCLSKKRESHFGMCRGLSDGPRVRPFPGGTRPHSSELRVPPTISLTLLPWQCVCDLRGNPTSPRCSSRKGFSAVRVNMWSSGPTEMRHSWGA